MDSLRGPELRHAPPAWGIREVALGSLLALLLFGGAAVAALAAGHGLQNRTDGPGPAYLKGAILALSELAFAAAAWAFGPRKPGVRWRDLGLRGFDLPIGCLAAMAFLGLSLAVSVAWGLALRLLGWPGQPPLLPLFGQGSLGLALALLGTGLIAPFSEEIFFRGFVFPALRQRLGLGLGIGITAALFAAAHFTPTVFPPIFVLGVFFCLLYQFTGSLWPGILLHAGINTLAVLAAYWLKG